MSLFSRKPRHPSTMRVDTLIGAGTQIRGDIEFKGGLHVDGTIEGNVSAIPGSESSLSISDGGVIQGTVRVPNVLLNGRIVGDVIAHLRVELGSTAQVHGDVHYSLIEIALGAQINGQLMHVGEVTQPAAAVTDSVVKLSDPAPEPALKLANAASAQ